MQNKKKVKEEKKAFNIVTPVTTKDACSYYRVTQLLQALDKIDGVKARVVDAKDPEKLLQQIHAADIVLLRPGLYALQKFLREEKIKGKIVFDHDDNTLLVHPLSVHYRELGTKDYYDEELKVWVWKDGVDGFSIERNVKAMMETIWQAEDADLHTCTTELMKEAFVAKKYAVVPNAINFDNYICPEFKESNDVRIGWQGGPSHFLDLVDVAPSIVRLIKKHKNTKLIIEGHYFPALFKEIEDRVETYPWIETSGFSWRAMCLNLDIALAPLAKQEFNLYKSSVKFYHAGALKIPTITPNMPPHSLDIVSGENGVLFESVEEFEQKLEELIVNKEERQRLGKNAYDWVKKNRNITDIAKQTLIEYKNLCGWKD